jgi:hypothetical protein
MPDLHGWITQQIDRIEALAREQKNSLWELALGDDSVAAAVLRRCAADRKILTIHAPAGGDWEPYACQGCGTDSEYGVLVDHTNDCETLLALAEGYGLTEEQRAQLDRPEPEPRQRRLGAGFLPDALAEAMYGNLIEAFIGTRPVESSKDKAIKILEPELKKISGYVPIADESGPA